MNRDKLNKKSFLDAKNIIPLEDAVGFPSRSSDLDVYPGFVSPPEGYGEVAFYWWLGDKLTKERIQWQIEQLKNKGVMGLQVNYAHSDKGGFTFGYTYHSDPPLFSEEWWELYNWFLKEAKKNNIAVSLSDYSLCSPGQGWYTDEVIVENHDLHGATLNCMMYDLESGSEACIEMPQNTIMVAAYRLQDSFVEPETKLNLEQQMEENILKWKVPQGKWRILVVYYIENPYSVDPMNPLTGQKIIEKFFQRFEDRNPGEGGRGLNFFFSDELSFGVSGNLWNGNFAEEFKKRKGYDLIPELAALFIDIGPRTPKIRLDYRDVMVALEEEAYFKPVFDWHQERGMIYGCDHGGRGKDVTKFGDYFRTQRWNQGPGNDQPCLQSDIIKNKVSSSIAHLYERPRTWLEGYHSSGWGTSSEQVADATFRNFVSGHNLLTLHGLYYSTHGGWWEWAPPCNHFRMPYWHHMGEFLKCSERLCYLLSQGVHRCDVAIMYPVAPVEADMDGETAVKTAFELGRYLYDQGIDFDFMDFQSLERAEINDRELRVAGEAFRVLVLPAMKAIRFTALQKALEFYRAGGIVIALGALPQASDRAGREDPEVDGIVKELFGTDSGEFFNREAAKAESIKDVSNVSGGTAFFLHKEEEVSKLINEVFPRDFACTSSLPECSRTWVMHRKIGQRDIYMIYGVPRETECFFRATGSAELWDPWTGKTRQLPILAQTEDGTSLRMPLEANEAQLIIFNSNDTAVLWEENILERDLPVVDEIALDGEWAFELKPTLDNRWGDFRLPAFDGVIGAEARKFRYMRESEQGCGWEAPSLDDSSWHEVTCSYGPYFYKLGPVDFEADREALEAELSKMTAVEESNPVDVFGKPMYWQTYDFSMRWGVENAPGHQGYHGLKEYVTDDFLVLGRSELSFTGSDCKQEGDGGRYYLWSAIHAPAAGEAKVRSGGMLPSRVWINGTPYEGGIETTPLKAGLNTLLLSYDKHGRAYFVLESPDAPEDWQQPYPLAMEWYNKPRICRFDIYPQQEITVGWYRFTATPGLTAMTMNAYGKLQCWVGGIETSIEAVKENGDGSAQYRVVLPRPAKHCEVVALRIEHVEGCYGGAALPEPIELECEVGCLKTGDWSEVDGLRCYSGGAWYRKSFLIQPDQAKAEVTVNLGEVISSAEVHVNGKLVGIKVAPPWKFDISGLVMPGENRMEVLVYNTLANHYLTIPTYYSGSLKSGLIGPVTIEISKKNR